ncbi:RSM22 [Candida theae]|uniref:RSM22 n=1 Tax=Candida theae TaxID=1198502 RepID=A0AAD5BCG3_9ASCO|nr:RSM22 [Candida theae]KAI5954774.1 RSM22 [Candida theae]
MSLSRRGATRARSALATIIRRQHTLPHSQSPKRASQGLDYEFVKSEDRSRAEILKNYLSQEQVLSHLEGEEDGPSQFEDRSPFRNEDGSLIKGNNALEARLDNRTLQGRVDHSVTALPSEIAKTIQNNILSTTIPAKLRERVVSMYQNLQKSQIQQAPSSELDCNAHIAGLFLQDYSHVKQVLGELRHRVGHDQFNPRRVLDIGYGPATGVVALNEIMGPDWVPEEKDAYIVGRKNNEMKKRAKIILSRQVNENFSGTGEPSEHQVDEEKEYVGPIDAKRIQIRTKLRDSMPVTKSYDLIIVHHSLLTREYNFPNDVDEKMRMILNLLAPNGHLVLVERGNSVGFETIARARQLMIRPENFPHELGKIPRPYVSGSSGKPQHLKKEDTMINEDDVEFEKEMLAKLDLEEAREQGINLETELDSKFGKLNEEEMKFDEEDDPNFDVLDVEAAVSDSSLEKIDYHLKVIAPCPHHRKCPLQLGDPKYYKIPSHKHRLNFCSFSKIMERPDYTMELKKGKKLAVKWDKNSVDGIGTLRRSELKKLGGKGRPGGRDTEDGSYSYLIVERSNNTEKSIAQINNLRDYSNSDNSPVGKDDINNWPRIVRTPDKLKKNVKLTVCSSEGNIETWQIPRSLGKQAYHDARKVQLGDLWALDKKASTKRSPISNEVKSKLDTLYKTQKKTFKKEQQRKVWRKKVGVSESEFDDGFLATEMMASKLESSRSYRKQGKRLDTNPEEYEGK